MTTSFDSAAFGDTADPSALKGEMFGLGQILIPSRQDSAGTWTATHGTAVNLSFGFAATNLHALPGFSTFTEGQRDTTRTVLAHFAEVAGLSFTEVNPGGLTNQATLLYGNYNAADGLAAQTGPPGNIAYSSLSGDVWVNTGSPPTEAALPGSAYFQVMLQQIGLSLGLPEPSAGPSPLFADTLTIDQIRALQLIYGADTTTRAGADTYGFGATAGSVYDFDVNIDPMLTIWDTGGIDRLDLARFSASQTVSLIPGTTSSIGGFENNVGIAFGTVIERVTGGRGADDITGNGAANLLHGGGGADVLRGGAGRDTLRGGAGGDTLYGGTGNDVLWGDDLDGIIANPAVAIDLVTTNGAQNARLTASNLDLFPTQSFTLEMIWQQRALIQPGEALRFGNLSLHRHTDGSGSIRFAGAETEEWLTGILPAGLSDGAAHRLSITYDDLDGRLVVYLDGVRSADHVFPTTTRGLSTTGDIVLNDHAALGDLRIFDTARSAQEIWDLAWTPLPDPANMPGLLHYWRGNGGNALVNYLPSLPNLQGLGPVGTTEALFGDNPAGNRMAGGTGDDVYHVLHSGDVVIEAAGEGRDQVYAYVDFTLGAGQAVERLTVATASGGVVLIGNALANRLTSAADSADTLRGGAGNDLYILRHSGDRVIEGASGGNDSLHAYANHSLAAGSAVETLYAMGAAVRSLKGNALANHLISNAAHADTMRGGAGNDLYTLHNARDRVIEAAGGGRDVIYSYVNHSLFSGSAVEELRGVGSAGLRLTGNALNNRIFGAAGADTLDGGAGQDRLWGGEGPARDVFVFRSLSHSAVGLSRDVIHDFDRGIDRIDLRGIDANNALTGNQAFGFSATGPLAYGVWLVTSASGLVLRADATGDGRADMEIDLTGLAGFGRGDVLL